VIFSLVILKQIFFQILNEEITPTLKKLKEERSTYLEFQKIQRELEHLTKLWLAYKFLSAEQAAEKLDLDAKEVEENLGKQQTAIKSGEFKILYYNKNQYLKYSRICFAQFADFRYQNLKKKI
jgi:chromosome segregation ATPase